MPFVRTATLMEKRGAANKGGERIDEIRGSSATSSGNTMRMIVLRGSCNERGLLKRGPKQVRHGLNAVKVMHQPRVPRVKETANASMAQPKEKTA
jgi:hypothetical protein